MSYKDLDKQREYQRKWTARRRADFLQGKKCPCGSVEKLELHHREPRHKTDHRIWSWTLERRTAEIAKCDVLCRKCHENATRIQLERSLQHATEWGYRHHRCRCELCTIAHSLEINLYRKNRIAKTVQKSPQK